MNAENRRAERIFAAALEIADPTERRAEHEHTRAGDEALRADVMGEALPLIGIPRRTANSQVAFVTTAPSLRIPPHNKAASLSPLPSN